MTTARDIAMQGNEEVEKQIADEEEIKATLEADGAKIALMLSRLRECQRIKARVVIRENPQTEAGKALIEQESEEEKELFGLHQEKITMYGKSISEEEDKTITLLDRGRKAWYKQGIKLEDDGGEMEEVPMINKCEVAKSVKTACNGK